MIINTPQSLEDNKDKILNNEGKVIHQIWLDYGSGNPEPPEMFKEFRDSWVSYHPDYIHIHWNNEMALDIVKKYYPTFEKYFISYPNPVSRVDALKYLALNLYGGFYIDMDMKCIGKLDHLLGQTLLFEIPQGYHKILTSILYRGYSNNQRRVTACNNSFLSASKPHHPFWKYVCEQLIGAAQSIFNKKTLLGVLSSAGPLFLESCFNSYADTDVRVLTLDEFKAFAVDYEGRTWLCNTLKWEIFFLITILLFVVLILTITIHFNSLIGIGLIILFIAVIQQLFPQYMLWIAFASLGFILILIPIITSIVRKIRNKDLKK
jgi:mannosyltransferase OCH1-like enzyme